MLQFITKLTSLGTRQGETAQKAGEFIIKNLKAGGTSYSYEPFTASLPIIKKVSLKIDGIKIPCKGSSLVSGIIKNKEALVSSLIPSHYLADVPNINFNPQSEFISQSNFYFAPAIAINRRDVISIMSGSIISGKVEVKKWTGKINHILVGNKKNPQTIIFSHYDSIGPGALDNASGVAVALALIVRHRQILDKTLFVFDGNEELSFDKPTYWGHGFRVFENKFSKILKKSKRIIVVDCVGNGRPFHTQDAKIINLAFPIKNATGLESKIFIVGGNIDNLMKIYHSDGDVPKILGQKYLEDTINHLLRLIAN